MQKEKGKLYSTAPHTARVILTSVVLNLDTAEKKESKEIVGIISDFNTTKRKTKINTTPRVFFHDQSQSISSRK